MIEVGRVCVKTAGKDAGTKVVVVDILEHNFVLIDGNVKRKRCNLAHLEPLDTVLNVKKNATHAEVVRELQSAGVPVYEAKPRTQKPKPVTKRGQQRKSQTP